nr:hypothetical protein CFP56_54597 [Quercus suber]
MEEVLQPSLVHIDKEMDTSENEMLGRKHLKAIDLELAKYDGEVDTDLQPRVKFATLGLLNDPEGLLGAEDGEHVTEIAGTHRVSTSWEKTTSLGGLVRGWKCLAREKAAMEQVSSPIYAKQGIQEYLEVMEDLVPTKRRCASVKSIETVKAGD